MTVRQISIIAFVLIAAFFVPRFLTDHPGLGPLKASSVAVAASEDDDNEAFSVTSRRGAGGHFHFDTLMNGTDVPVMVDTGASVIAINLSTAEAIGLDIDTEGHTVTVNTANGKSKAWPAQIEEVIIGELVVEDVRALVLSDEALSGTLLGMSFLNKLSSFNIEGGVLTLVQ